MRLLTSLFVVLVALVEAPPTAHACTLVPPGVHDIDPAHSTDTVAPSAVTANAIVERQDTRGCMNAQSKCGGGAWITIAVSATDNAATPDTIGYQVRVVGGEPPRGLVISDMPLTAPDFQLHFYFESDDQAGFELDLELRARDLNGNLGPPTVLKVGEPGDGGCSTSGSGPLGGVSLALVALLARRRRSHG